MLRLSKPYIPETVFENVRKLFESGNLVQGIYVAQFEQVVSEYLDVPYVRMVSSGTAALHVALLALDFKPGDEIIVPAFTFPATSNVVEIIGAKPVLVDINLSDFCLNADLIEEKITEKTKAIIPVHEFGQAAELSPILKIAKKYGLKIIEDAACALGTEYHNIKVGTLGDIGCFSLHPRKAITTGEGGIIVSKDKRTIERVDLLRNHGMLKNLEKVDFMMPGLNYRMTELQAVLGIPQLREISSLIDRRIDQASLYSRLLADNKHIITPGPVVGRKNIYQTYHLLIREYNRDRLIEKLKKSDIETNIGAQALNCLTFYKSKYNLCDSDFPNATDAYKSGLALPIGWHISSEDVSFISQKLLNCFV